MTTGRTGEAAEAGPWSVRVSVGEVPEQGRHVELTADEKQAIQKAIFDLMMQRVSWCKHERIAKASFPWLEKEKVF